MSLKTLTEEHKPISVELFLDTTIHCSRFKGPLFQPRIYFAFRFFNWRGTSSYTKVEFGNVVLAQAQYYLTLRCVSTGLRQLLFGISVAR